MLVIQAVSLRHLVLFPIGQEVFNPLDAEVQTVASLAISFHYGFNFTLCPIATSTDNCPAETCVVVMVKHPVLGRNRL